MTGKKGKDYVSFDDKLKGAVGKKAVFMATPGLLPFAPTRGTPPVSTLLVMPPLNKATILKEQGGQQGIMKLIKKLGSQQGCR